MTISQIGIYLLLFMILAAFSFWMMRPRADRPSRKLDRRILAFNVSALVLGFGILMWSSAFRFEDFQEAGPGEIGGKGAGSGRCEIFQNVYTEMFMGQGVADVTRPQRLMFGSPAEPEFNDPENLMKRAVTYAENFHPPVGAIPNPCETPIDYSFLIPFEGMFTIGSISGNNHPGLFSVIRSLIIINGVMDLSVKVFYNDGQEIASNSGCGPEPENGTTYCSVNFFVSEYPSQWGDGHNNQYGGLHEVRFYDSDGNQLPGTLKYFGERFRY